MLLQITMLDGRRLYCVLYFVFCDRWIYDYNSIILQNSIANLDLCARLHVDGLYKNFASTGMAYYFLSKILNFDKINTLL